MTTYFIKMFGLISILSIIACTSPPPLTCSEINAKIRHAIRAHDKADTLHQIIRLENAYWYWTAIAETQDCKWERIP